MSHLLLPLFMFKDVPLLLFRCLEVVSSPTPTNLFC